MTSTKTLKIMNIMDKKKKAVYEALNKKFDPNKNDIGGLTIEEYHRMSMLYNYFFDKGYFKKK